MPNVYCYFDSSEHADSNQGPMLKLWVRSWKARGWTPRILTVRNAAKHPQFKHLKHDHRELPRLAQEATPGVKWVSPIADLNFSFTPAKYRKSGVPAARHFHATGWETASVVEFDNVHDVAVIENCGRPL